jgi:hypothetical protein
MSCNLTIDGRVNATVNTTNNTLTSATVSTLQVGSHTWNVTCADQAGNSNTSETRIFNITNLLPIVTQLAPQHQIWNNSASIVFLYNVSEPDQPQFNSSKNYSAMSAYRSTTSSGANFPKYRNWTGASWSTEGELSTSGSPLRWVEMASSTFYQRPYEKILVTSSNDGFIDAYIWNGSTWSLTANIANISVGSSTTRSMDVEYETSTGRAILVYAFNSGSTTEDFAYNIWNGTNWSAPHIMNDPLAAADIQINYVQLARNPNTSSNQLALIYIDSTNADAQAWIWNGTNFTSQQTVSSELPITTEEDISIAYEQQRYGVLAVAGNASTVNWTYFNGATWNSSGNFDINSGAAGNMNFFSLKSDPASNRIMLTSVDASSDLTTSLWNTGSWSGTTIHDTGLDSNAARSADFNWEQTNSRGLLVFGTTVGQLDYRTYSGGSFGAQSAVSTGDAATHPWIELQRVPDTRTGATRILGAFESSGNALGSIMWNGSGAPALSVGALTATVGLNNFQAFDISPDMFLPAAITNPFFTLANCSLFVNGVFNQSNATMVYLEYVNNFTVSTFQDGVYTWSVLCTDTNGLSNGTANRTLNIDRTPPLVNLTAPANASNVTTLMVNLTYVSVDNLASWTLCNITVDGVVNVSNINSTNNTAITRQISGGGDAAHFWNVTCVDIAGNSNTSAMYFYNTSAPPAITLTSPANNGFSNGSPLQLFYNVTDNGNIQNCSLDFDGLFNQSNQSQVQNGLGNNFTLANVNEGLHNWSVTCYDAGNLSATSSLRNITVDRTPPQVNLSAPDNNSIMRSSVVIVNWTAIDNIDTSLTCNVTRKGPDGTDNTKSNLASANGTLTATTYTALPDGQHFWNVTCIDDAGNRNFSITYTYNVSSPPSVTLVSPPTNNRNNTGNLTFQYVPFQSGGIANCTLIINNVANQTNTSITNNGNNFFYLNNLSDASYNWSVNCTDTSGGVQNSTTLNFTVDKISPIISLISPVNTSIVTVNSVPLAYNASDERTPPLVCTVFVNGTGYGVNTTVQNGTSQTTTVLLRGGNQSYSWNATCRDQANNTNTSHTWMFNIIAPPNVTLQSPSNNSVTTRNITFTYTPADPFSFTNCSILIDDVINQTNYTVTNATVNNFTINNLPSGTHNWTVRCYDLDNDTFAPDVRYFSSDANAPAITLNAPDNAYITPNASIVFNWTAVDDFSSSMSCNLTVDGINRSIQTVSNNTPTTATVSSIFDGNHLWNVTCDDQVQNRNTSETRTFTLSYVPTITQSSPADGNITNNGTVIFTFTPSDNDGFTNCSIAVGDILISNQSLTRNGLPNNITGTLATGRYNWSVLCYDNGTLLNVNQTGNRSLTVNLFSPNISLNSPSDGSTTNVSWILFNWTANETFGGNLFCNVTINGTVRLANVNTPSATPTTGNVTWLNDSYQIWNVTCRDPANNANTSTTRSFTIAAPPEITLQSPNNALRTNATTINFTYTPSDNSGIITACSIVINGIVNNTFANPTNGTLTNFTIPGFSNGTYDWSINCTDLFGNVGNSSGRTLLIDLYPPEIVLNAPGNMSSVGTNVTFNWTATDSSTIVTCNFTLDGVINVSNITGVSGVPFLRNITNIAEGSHQWNVTCWDDLLIANTSLTYNFTVRSADLILNDSTLITFNNSNPNENDTINITANVTNTGGVAASNFFVTFWDGTPGSGTLIGNVTVTLAPNQSRIVSTLWNITAGFHTIYAYADYENIITESDDANNNAARNISFLRVLINSPANATMTGDTTPEINFTIQNFTGGTFTYTIFVDGTANGQNGTALDNTSTLLNISALAEGVHTIIVQANDSGRAKNSSRLTIIIDLTPPSPVFLTRNGTFFNGSNFDVAIRINDTFDTDINHTIFVNGTANVSGNVTNATARNVTLSSFTNGTYNLTLQGLDSAGNAANGTSIIIYVDSVPPNITLNSPANATTFQTRNIPLNFTPDDNLDEILQCSVVLDASTIATMNASRGVPNVTVTSAQAEGTHNWNVTCWDGDNAISQVNNQNTSVTWTFNIFIPPLITLMIPPNNTLSSSDTQTFFFNVTDETGLSNCSLIINETIVQTKNTTDLIINATNNFTQSGLNNSFNWSVTCTDNSTGSVTNTTGSYNLTIDTVGPNISILTATETWFNTGSPGITINATDNYATTMNISLYVDGVQNVNSTTPNATATTVNLSGVSNGTHTIIAQATDRAGNPTNSTSITIYIDTVAPTVTLLAPPNATNLTDTSVTLNFTVSDNMALSLQCNLSLDNVMIQQYNLTNGTVASQFIGNLSSGFHYWNATCIDNATNRGTSQTFFFFIYLPDLAISAGNITLSNSTPAENQTIQVNATVFNIGLLNTTNIAVQLWRGSPVTGTLIGNTTIGQLGIGENVTLSFNYTTILGLNTLSIAVDPPLATNGSIVESNESNNLANQSAWVGLFEVFAGSQGGTLHIADSTILPAYTWNQTETTGSNVFVADTDSVISFVNLQALGRNSTNGTSTGTNDFLEVDTRLNTTTFNDSINLTYTVVGTAKELANITAFKRNINFVPVVNSTNTSSFITGILWDVSDGGSFYNGSQDVILISVMNQSMDGFYGTYDYEIAVPARLRDYIAGGGTVTFYTELR